MLESDGSHENGRRPGCSGGTVGVCRKRHQEKEIPMNGKMAKRLRKMAKFEMSAGKQVIDRELVLARFGRHDRVINEPLSVRYFYLQLKEAYNNATRSSVAKKQQPVED
jgi:hypothetical protein